MRKKSTLLIWEIKNRVDKTLFTQRVMDVQRFAEWRETHRRIEMGRESQAVVENLKGNFISDLILPCMFDPQTPEQIRGQELECCSVMKPRAKDNTGFIKDSL